MAEKLGRFIGLVVVLLLIAGAVVLVQTFGTMSPDAKAMGVGVLSMGLACLVPVVVMALIGGVVALVWVRVQAERRAMRGPAMYGPQYPQQFQQPPVLIVGGMGGPMGYGQYPQHVALPRDAWEMGGSSQRTFNVIGEED